MDIGSATENIENKSTTFLSHVFNFDDTTKNSLLNISQYTILAILPIVLLNKAVQQLFPEPQEDKNNIELLAEIIGQLIFMMVCIFFIHRVITFVPTYSKTEYGELNLFNAVLLFLSVMLSIQTRLGQKINILIDRLINYYEGKPQHIQENKNNNYEPPISQPQTPPPPPIMTQPTKTMPDIQPPQSQQPTMTQPTMAQQPQMNIQFDNMYEKQIEAFGSSTNSGLGFSFL